MKKGALIMLAMAALPVISFGGDITVNVRGLVCPSCGVGIKKHLKKTKKVDKVKFNINSQLVYIVELKNQTLTDKEINTAIINAGYEIGKNGIKRN